MPSKKNTRYFQFFADRTPWLNISIRSLLAGFGGYGLACLIAASLTLGLPLPRFDAVVIAMISAFVSQMLYVIVVFASATVLRALVYLMLAAVPWGLWLIFLPAGTSS